MTEFDIQRLLYIKMVSDSQIAVPNSNCLGWEADLLIVTKALFVHEFEIKISHSDFLAEKKKDRYEQIPIYLSGKREYNIASHFGYDYRVKVNQPANYFWYVCPKGIISTEEVPDYAGLIVIKEDKYLKVEKKAPRLHREKLTQSHLIRLCRSINYRYWSNRNKEEKQKEENKI